MSVGDGSTESAIPVVGESAPIEPSSAADPGYASVLKYMLYGLSLPERALRSGVSVVGGTIRESASLLVPQAFQDSKTYDIFVKQTLDFVLENVGGVAAKAPTDGHSAPSPAVENFVARKAIGNFMEMASLATVHLSPVLLLAIVSDVAYGSRGYLAELASELQQQGVIDANSTINSAQDLLNAVGNASGVAAGTFNTPPLSVDGLKSTIDQTTAAVREIDPTQVLPQAEIERLWTEMRDIAKKENVGLLDVSGAMTLYALGKAGVVARGALSTVTVAGRLFDRVILDHYRGALGEIHQRGYYPTLAQASAPYVEAVWKNFSTDKVTVTEDILSGRLIGRTYSAVARWLGGK